MTGIFFQHYRTPLPCDPSFALSCSLSSSDICHGLGGFACWVGILKFFEWDSELYMLILSVKASLARIGKFILTVSPVYMAYVMVVGRSSWGC